MLKMDEKSTMAWTIDTWRNMQLEATPQESLNRLLALVKSFDKLDPAWISIANEEQIKKQWEDLFQSPVDMLKYPLFGVPFAVKDNIDAFGFPTTAACPDFAYDPTEDATTVRLLKAVGGIVVGKTNMDQFATGLVGTRSPYGKPQCAFSPIHVSGGSSSGSATVVARGLVPFALGTDTAGSGRVPAHLNNLIGLKPTCGIFSCKGVLPACRSLDCVSIFSLILSDAQLVFSILAKYDAEYSYSRSLPDPFLATFGPHPRFAVPDLPIWYEDELNRSVFNECLRKFENIGVEIVLMDFSLLYKLAACLYEGPWVAERYAVLKDFMHQHPESIDPTVYEIVKQAEKFSAADCFQYEYLRKDLLLEIRKTFADYDGFIVPTAPLNPTFSEVAAEPIMVNSKQGTYTNFVNLADLSALAIPGGFRSDKLPFGITLISKAFHDYALLDLAERFLDKDRQIGATILRSNEGDLLNNKILKQMSTKYMEMVVVGSHLSGMSLNYQLEEVSAVFQRKTKTSTNYRLYALSNTVPAKPGLKRIDSIESSGEAIDVEVWDVPLDQVGNFIAMVPPPLAIGSVELENGKWVKGFVCEETGFKDGLDITAYGGWKEYMNKIKS